MSVNSSSEDLLNLMKDAIMAEPRVARQATYDRLPPENGPVIHE